jgi:2'-5' RNA ligase
MIEAWRCFLAVRIDPSDRLRRVLAELTGMGRALAAVDPARLHVTLKFLGDVETTMIPQVEAAAAEVARTHQPFVMSVVGLGVFPHAARPSVVWAGLEEADKLVEIATDLDGRLAACGLAREERPFVPHLTLARVKARPPETLRTLLDRHSATVFGTAPVDRIELMRSQLGPNGARHTPLATALLGTPRAGT